MASPTRWTWVWVSSRSWWWTGKPGVLQSMGSQRVAHNWWTELNWIYKRKKEPAKCHEFVPQLLLQSSCYLLTKTAYLKSPTGSRPKWLHLPGCVCLAERVSVGPAMQARATASWGLELPPGAWDIPQAEGWDRTERDLGPLAFPAFPCVPGAVFWEDWRAGQKPTPLGASQWDERG